MEDMKPFAVALAGLVLAGGLALAVSTVSTGVGAFGPVYTVSELRADLADNPHAWLGHTVLVRGVALGLACPPNASCVFAWPALVDADATGPGSFLPLSMGPANPLLALLRRLPLVGRFVPGPQLLRWGRPAIYRVQVQDAAGTSPNGTRRYAAVLLDPAPPGHGPMPAWRGIMWPVMPPQPQPVPGSTMPLRLRHLLERGAVHDAAAEDDGVAAGAGGVVGGDAAREALPRGLGHQVHGTAAEAAAGHAGGE
jgi:hypothetical protein